MGFENPFSKPKASQEEQNGKSLKKNAALAGVIAMGGVAAFGAKDTSDHYAQGPDTQPVGASAEAPASAMESASLSSTDAPPPVTIEMGTEPQVIELHEAQGAMASAPQHEKHVLESPQPQTIPLAGSERQTIELRKTQTAENPIH